MISCVYCSKRIWWWQQSVPMLHKDFTREREHLACQHKRMLVIIRTHDEIQAVLRP